MNKPKSCKAATDCAAGRAYECVLGQTVNSNYSQSCANAHKPEACFKACGHFHPTMEALYLQKKCVRQTADTLKYYITPEHIPQSYLLVLIPALRNRYL